MSDHQKDDALSYRPAAWYFRAAIRKETDIEKLKVTSECLVDEIEELKAQVRRLGQIPVRVYDVTRFHPDEDYRQRYLHLNEAHRLG